MNCMRRTTSIAFVAGAMLFSSLSLGQASASDSDLKLGPTKSPYSEIDRLVKSKSWGSLVTLSTDLLQKDPSNTTLLYWLGISHLQLHEPVATVQTLRLAEHVGLNTALAHEALGLAYYDLNQFQLFEDQMEKAETLDPKDSKPDYYLGLYRWTIRSDASGALAHFEKAIQAQPLDWKSLYQAGNCEEQLSPSCWTAASTRPRDCSSGPGPRSAAPTPPGPVPPTWIPATSRRTAAMPDPFESLHAPVTPVDPDPAFAARLRAACRARPQPSEGSRRVRDRSRSPTGDHRGPPPRRGDPRTSRYVTPGGRSTGTSTCSARACWAIRSSCPTAGSDTPSSSSPAGSCTSPRSSPRSATPRRSAEPHP